MSAPRKLFSGVVIACAVCPFLLLTFRHSAAAGVLIELKCQRNYLLGSEFFMIGESYISTSDKVMVRREAGDMANSIPTWCHLDYAGT